LVFQETATVICRRCRERNIDCDYALDIFSSFAKELNLIETPFKAFEILKKMKKCGCKLSFVDSVLLELANSNNFEILTFDVGLRKCEKQIKERKNKT
jgi:predicted nucleic acid-binding protein